MNVLFVEKMKNIYLNSYEILLPFSCGRTRKLLDSNVLHTYRPAEIVPALTVL